jgi:hypothetical protein
MPIDCLNHNVPVYDPDERGCYEWMSVKAGKPSKFCDDVDFYGLTRLFGDLEVENITVQPPDGEVTLPIDQILCGNTSEIVVNGGPSYTLNQTFQEMAAYFCRRNRQAVARVGLGGTTKLDPNGSPNFRGFGEPLCEFPNNSFITLQTVSHLLQFDNTDITIIPVTDTFTLNTIQCPAIRAPGFYEISANFVIERWGAEDVKAGVGAGANTYPRDHARLHVMTSIRPPTLATLALDPTDVRQLTLDNTLVSYNDGSPARNFYDTNWYQTASGSIAIQVTQQVLDLAAAANPGGPAQVWVYAMYANSASLDYVANENATYIKATPSGLTAVEVAQIPPGGDWRNYGGQGTVITVSKIGDANLP